jgi:hypothetical protein
VYLFRSVKGSHTTGGWTLVAAWTGGFAEDTVTRYKAAEGVPFVLPPPSNLDELGEEAG